VAGLFTGIAAVPATADAVSDRQAQAQALANQIEVLGNKEAALSEQYDKAVLDAQTASTKVQQASIQASNAETSAARARSVLTANAITAYVNGGTLAQLASRSTHPMAAAENIVLRGEYVHSLAGTQADALDGFRNAAFVARAAQAGLQAAHRQAQKSLADLDNARNATIASQRKLEATLGQVKGEIGALITQAQAAKQAEAARQTAVFLAAQRTVANRSAAPAGGSGRSASVPVPPVGQGAAAAVSAALSRVGLPYVWGAAGPSAFDCSGLTMWAWAHAGVSLPHFSGAQYASTHHIPMSQLQPGDLVFFANPGEHEAMYIGGGQIVEAAHSGVPVRVGPLYSGFALASRP
jgi:cell wall-associated NlpC family hydrolase